MAIVGLLHDEAHIRDFPLFHPGNGSHDDGSALRVARGMQRYLKKLERVRP